MKLLQAPFFAGLTLRTIPAVEECNWSSQEHVRSLSPLFWQFISV